MWIANRQPHPHRPACVSHLHSDGCLLGHRLVHADEGYVVVQVIDRALEEEGGSRCRALGLSPLISSPAYWWSKRAGPLPAHPGWR